MGILWAHTGAIGCIGLNWTDEEVAIRPKSCKHMGTLWAHTGAIGCIGLNWTDEEVAIRPMMLKEERIHLPSSSTSLFAKLF